MYATKTVSIPSHLEIVIRRPDGTIETVIHPTLKQITPRVFEQMRVATRAAGKGECISYRTVMKDVAAPQPTAADLADEQYRRSTAAIYRASAGGERDETTARADNTPSHKSDY